MKIKEEKNSPERFRAYIWFRLVCATVIHALGARQVSVRLAPVQDSFGSSTRLVGVASQVLRFRVRYQLSQSCCLSLLSWRCLAASTSFFLHTAMDLRPPSVTVSTYTFTFNAIVFQSLVMQNTRVSLRTQSVHSFSFTLYSLRTALSTFPNTIYFGKRPPLIRMSAPAHKRPLVRNVVSMLSHPVISRARLYEVIRWPGLLCYAPMM